jgi:hypothetical protein
MMDKPILSISKDDLLEMVNYMEDESDEIDDLTDFEVSVFVQLAQDSISDAVREFSQALRMERSKS